MPSLCMLHAAWSAQVTGWAAHAYTKACTTNYPVARKVE